MFFSPRSAPESFVAVASVCVALALLCASSAAVARGFGAPTAGIKPPSGHVVDNWKKLRGSLPFEDERDFEEAKRGLVAVPGFRKIMRDGGGVAYDIGKYDWLLQGKDFESVHPSLQRQAVLNMAYGLYEVVPGKIYQVRGFDLANMTILRGEKGWVLMDVLTTVETARAALKFANDTLGKRPVSAVIFSHAHVDHFGGVLGVVDAKDVESGRVPIVAPKDFMKYAVSENVYAGNAMSRRTVYQYGTNLERSPFGHVDQAIGKGVAQGTISLLGPTLTIEKPYETHVLDGLRVEFQLTPGTESPAEMNAWFPDMKAFWAAENITGTIHNIYTLRGALVRDALLWSKYINKAIYRYGKKADFMFAAHSWPRFGRDRVLEVMVTQRDAYAHLNNTVLHHVNNGVTINEIHDVYELPKSLASKWAARSYHGSEAHNSKAVVDKNIGYWDANPATLLQLPPKKSAPLYVEMMGGAGAIMRKAGALHAGGKYREAIEILNKLVYAEPRNVGAKRMLADSFEQLGYTLESTSTRNAFLAAAAELRNGVDPTGVDAGVASVTNAMTMGMFLDFLGIRLRPGGLEGKRFKINVVVTDEKRRYVLEASNDALVNVAGFLADDADLTVKGEKLKLFSLFSGGKGGARGVEMSGDASLVDTVKGAMAEFDRDFEIMPGTKRGRRA